jgi:hypothetical protein
LVGSWVALGAILASGFGYNVFFLHETQHGFHIRFSFSPCSAAVRAQHMEYIGKTMVLEGFPNFRVFENGFLKGPILIPQW